MDGRVAAVALLAAIAAGCLTRAFVRQPARLAARVQPYTTAHRRALGTARPAMADEAGPRRSGVQLVFGPFIQQLAKGLASVIEHAFEQRQGSCLGGRHAFAADKRLCQRDGVLRVDAHVETGVLVRIAGSGM